MEKGIDVFGEILLSLTTSQLKKACAKARYDYDDVLEALLYYQFNGVLEND